jgi:hypothetical protein
MPVGDLEDCLLRSARQQPPADYGNYSDGFVSDYLDLAQLVPKRQFASHPADRARRNRPNDRAPAAITKRRAFREPLALSGLIGKSTPAWIGGIGTQLGARLTQKEAAEYIINAMNAYLQTAGLA